MKSQMEGDRAASPCWAEMPTWHSGGCVIPFPLYPLHGFEKAAGY